MRTLIGISLIIFLVSCSSSMTPSALDRHIKSGKKHGFTFQNKPTGTSWIVAFQGPGMKQAWSLMIAVSKSPDESGKNGLVFVSVGTTIWQGRAEPSRETMSYLLQMNATDNNIGSLSLFREKDGWYIQYFTRLPLKYLTKEWLQFAVGFVTGFSDAASEKLKGMK